MSSTNPILSQAMEIRLFLESKMKEDLNNDEIRILLLEKFPFVKGITAKHIAQYRGKFLPNYKQSIIDRQAAKLKASAKTETEIEKEIIEQVEHAEIAGEEFNKPSDKKIDMLKAFRSVLKQMYTNYDNIRMSDDEVNKKGYLVELIKALKEIKELEASEKSLLSALADIRTREQSMSSFEYTDHIKSWSLLRCGEKCKTKEELYGNMDSIKTFIDDYKKIVETSDNPSEANRVTLEKFYVVKKARNEVKPSE